MFIARDTGGAEPPLREGAPHQRPLFLGWKARQLCYLSLYTDVRSILMGFVLHSKAGGNDEASAKLALGAVAVAAVLTYAFNK